MGKGKLLPCPFCGSEAYIARSTPSSGPYWAVCAGDCILEGPVKDTEAEALAAWNRRAAPPSGAEPVAWPGRNFCETAERNVAELAKWIKGKDDKQVASDAALAIRTLLASPQSSSQVTEEMVEAGAKALWQLLKVAANVSWQDACEQWPGDDLIPAGLRRDARAVLTAALSPGKGDGQ